MISLQNNNIFDSMNNTNPINVGSIDRVPTTTLISGGLYAMAIPCLPPTKVESQVVVSKICSSCGFILPATGVYFPEHKGRP